MESTLSNTSRVDHLQTVRIHHLLQHPCPSCFLPLLSWWQAAPSLNPMELLDEGGQTVEPSRRASSNGLLAQEMPSSFVQPRHREREVIHIPSERRTQLTDERVNAEILAQQT